MQFDEDTRGRSGDTGDTDDSFLLAPPAPPRTPRISRAGGQRRIPRTQRTQRAVPELFSMLRLAHMRMASRSWLLGVVAIGVLVIDILACTVPLYLKLIATTQLQTTIAQAPAPSRNMQIYAYSDAKDAAIHQWAATQIETEAQQNLASFSAAAPLRYLQSDVLTLMQAGSAYTYTAFAPQNAQLDSFDFAMIHTHMRLLVGRLPQTAPVGQPTQVLITQEMADGYDLHVGQRLTIVRRLNNRADIQHAPVPLLITGIWTPLSDIDPFWNGLRFHSTFTPLQTNPPPIWPLLTTEPSLYATLGALPQTGTVGVTQTWVYYVDPDRVTTSASATISDDLTTFRVRLANVFSAKSSAVQWGMRGHLEQLIQDAQLELNLLSLPLYMIALQIVGLALLFVAAMARLLVTAQEQEIVTLKSRGASSPQLLGIFTAQSVPPGVLAIVAGPLLALGLALLLVRAFLPGSAADLTSVIGPTNLADMTSLTSLSHAVAHILPIITPAIVGSVVGIGVVVASGFSVARLDVLAFRRELARPTHIPFWQRYYLDLGLVVLCIVGYLELSQFGTTQARLQLDAQSANSLLLLVAPALLLLAGGLLLLRLVPLAARLGARLAQRGRGLAALLSLAQIARTPTRYARMILLLALAVGLGFFALVFDASLSQNMHDRIAYATGADIRLQTFATVGGQEASVYSQRLLSLSGVQTVTSTYRTSGSVQIGQQQLQTADILGVDPGTFAGVVESTSWRSDFATQPLPALMAQLRAHQGDQSSAETGGTGDAGTQAHPLWAIVSATLAQRAHLHAGDRFQVTLADVAIVPTSAVVGAIVSAFPTLYPDNAPAGFLVFSAHDLSTAIAANAVAGTAVGANEFWLRTAGDLATDRKLMQTLNAQQFHFSISAAQSSREELAQAAGNPINGGMRGLLLLGALVAALLAVLGSLVQAVLAARQRTRQFAVLRTLGMATRQLTGTLLSEQLVVYLFGLLGGTALGLILMTATVPYLQFSDSLVDPTTVGVPGYLLRINWLTTGAFYGALMAAFILALLITARFAATIGLSKTLRIGED